MNLAKCCTIFLFVIISFGIQVLNWWIIAKFIDDDDFLFIIAIVIFLWNVIAPIILVYRLLVERGLL